MDNNAKNIFLAYKTIFLDKKIGPIKNNQLVNFTM